MKTVIPKYFLGPCKLVRNIVATACFAVAFLAVYTPMSSTAWFDLNDTKNILLTIGMVSTGIVIAAGIKGIIYYISRKREISLPEYIIWNIAEIVVIACLYSIVTATIIDCIGIGFWEIFPKGLIITAVVISIPLSLSHLYTYCENSKLNEKKFREQKDEIAPRAEIILKDNESYLREYDVRGVIRLMVPVRDIILFESQDNYVLIYYFMKDRVMKHLLRTKMMIIEEKFSSESFARCHRCYIVNTEWVKEMKKDTKNYLTYIRDVQMKPIPVSKKYFDSFTEMIHQKIDIK